MKFLLIILLAASSFSVHAKGLVGESHTEFQVSHSSIDANDSSIFGVSASGYSNIQQGIDAGWSASFGRNYDIPAPGVLDVLDVYSIAGLVRPYFKTDSLITPYVNLAGGLNIVSDYFSEYYYNTAGTYLAISGGVGAEVDFDRVVLDISYDIAKVLDDLFSRVNSLSLSAYLWNNDASAIGFGYTSSKDEDGNKSSSIVAKYVLDIY